MRFWIKKRWRSCLAQHNAHRNQQTNTPCDLQNDTQGYPCNEQNNTQGCPRNHQLDNTPAASANVPSHAAQLKNPYRRMYTKEKSFADLCAPSHPQQRNCNDRK